MYVNQRELLTASVLGLMLLVCAACGSDPSSGGTSIGGPTAGGGAVGASGGSTASAGSSSGIGAGGAGGNGVVDCSGTFREPELLFTSDAGWLLGSPTVTGDELEIFDPEFQEETTNSAARIVVRRRASPTDAFSSAVVLDEFNGLCDPSDESTSLDVSADGLRLYVACVSTGGGPLYRATRSSRSLPFVVSTTPVGIVGFYVGLSGDELSAWTLNPQGEGMFMYRRSRTDENFDSGQPVPGLTQQQLNSPEPTPDGLGLFGSILLPSIEYGLAIARRASASSPFSSPEVGGLPVTPPSTSDYGPSISTDCRRLYFVRESGVAPKIRSMMVARR